MADAPALVYDGYIYLEALIIDRSNNPMGGPIDGQVVAASGGYIVVNTYSGLSDSQFEVHPVTAS